MTTRMNSVAQPRVTCVSLLGNTAPLHLFDGRPTLLSNLRNRNPGRALELNNYYCMLPLLIIVLQGMCCVCLFV
jgi:hypothetical protein